MVKMQWSEEERDFPYRGLRILLITLSPWNLPSQDILPGIIFKATRAFRLLHFPRLHECTILILAYTLFSFFLGRKTAWNSPPDSVALPFMAPQEFPWSMGIPFFRSVIASLYSPFFLNDDVIILS